MRGPTSTGTSGVPLTFKVAASSVRFEPCSTAFQLPEGSREALSIHEAYNSLAKAISASRVGSESVRHRLADIAQRLAERHALAVRCNDGPMDLPPVDMASTSAQVGDAEPQAQEFVSADDCDRELRGLWNAFSQSPNVDWADWVVSCTDPDRQWPARADAKTVQAMVHRPRCAILDLQVAPPIDFFATLDEYGVFTGLNKADLISFSAALLSSFWQACLCLPGCATGWAPAGVMLSVVPVDSMHDATPGDMWWFMRQTNVTASLCALSMVGDGLETELGCATLTSQVMFTPWRKAYSGCVLDHLRAFMVRHIDGGTPPSQQHCNFVCVGSRALWIGIRDVWLVNDMLDIFRDHRSRRCVNVIVDAAASGIRNSAVSYALLLRGELVRSAEEWRMSGDARAYVTQAYNHAMHYYFIRYQGARQILGVDPVVSDAFAISDMLLAPVLDRGRRVHSSGYVSRLCPTFSPDKEPPQFGECVAWLYELAAILGSEGITDRAIALADQLYRSFACLAHQGYDWVAWGTAYDSRVHGVAEEPTTPP